MHKKSFVLVSVILFVLCIFSGFVSANTGDVKNGVSNVTNAVVDGVNRMGSDVRNSIGSAENGVEDALRMNDTKINDNVRDYSATRTATNGITNNTSTMWVWVIVAIAAIVIIGLVWYYGSTNNNHHNDE